MRLGFLWSAKRWVPHISLVFREMWDTTGLDPFTSKNKSGLESYEGRAVESHISRKTSEMWGTRGFVGRTKHISLVFVATVAVAVVLVWITLAFRAKRQAKPITDLGVTMPLNQPGGAPASAEAYEVYSALYQAPVEEMLAFAEDSVTDVPQVNGSCLRPATAQEQEMTVAFVAANRQSHRWERKFSIPQGYRLLPQLSSPERRHAGTHIVTGNASYSNSGMFGFWGIRDSTTRTHGLWYR